LNIHAADGWRRAGRMTNAVDNLAVAAGTAAAAAAALREMVPVRCQRLMSVVFRQLSMPHS